MIYRILPNPEGDYADAAKNRFDLLLLRRITTNEGQNVGWQEFTSLHTCLTAWGLRYSPVSAVVER